MKLSALVFLALLGLASTLEWVTWPGSLPNGAVSIYNDYTKRTDYVCKSIYRECHCGFYNPDLGSKCNYPYGDKEWYAYNFKILVNKDNELLEWKGDSYGSVPQHSVRTCSRRRIYVGKNKYGLGKVDSRNDAFFLPWKGDEYWYKSYQVLTINRDVVSQHISDVKYFLDEARIIRRPPETLRIFRTTNNGCQNVVKTATLSKTTEVWKTWNIGISTMLGVKTEFSAGIPLISSGTIEVTVQRTLEFNYGTTKKKIETHKVTEEVPVPPNHSCAVRMEGRQIKVDIPYTARLSRTYRNGETRWTSITGKYNGVETGEFRAVVDRCKPVANAKPCP